MQGDLLSLRPRGVTRRGTILKKKKRTISINKPYPLKAKGYQEIQ